MKRIVLCAFLAATVTAMPALAQDEADKGWYFGLRTGIASLNNPDLAIIDTVGSGKLQFGDDEDVTYRLGKTRASLFQVGLRFTL